ncbi:hypothetical protein [Pseudomonas petrae]|uniref:Uncharacterized protein n=1 Tax=Pseudomonas petrae TaxID=2912190 RepID=A0ABS9IAL9_9PSED|nr:hypothetical protein [Pseudomonas petrae]MCF7531004.1 hypothetical protein [Pseudomonas petrae]MCF7536680.1 hypothetical protein [Pseudomonas petrae]MCF7544291.1 hypothetical protein [Pseudomonas petrae]MCF7554359.1 hypothetical protein [Pseudomonas petrae]
MSMKVTGPVDQGLGLNSSNFASPQGRLTDQRQAGGGVDFGVSPGTGAQSVSYGGPSAQSSDSRVTPGERAANPTDQDLAASLRNLVEQIMQALAQLMQQSRSDTGASSQGRGGSPQGKSATISEAGQPVAANAASEPAAAASGVAGSSSAVPDVASSSVRASTSSADAQAAPTATAALASAGKNTAVGDAATAGSGPYSLNITNTQDHAIKIGQFDKNEKLVGELSLEPGQKGTMKYEADTTGLLKQADAHGNYKPDASRLEFYNGFINTSDIDGRNAAIHASDGKGFEVGDKQSIADKAPDSITTRDSAGNKTIAGWYDGSTEKMKQGGDFLTKELGTGMTYQHPNDDTLGQGSNPMRHTDSMSLDVVFGKA